MVSAKEQSDCPIDALMLFMKAYAEYYENYPAITAITQSYDVLQYNPELVERVRRLFGHAKCLQKHKLMKRKRKI